MGSVINLFSIYYYYHITWSNWVFSETKCRRASSRRPHQKRRSSYCLAWLLGFNPIVHGPFIPCVPPPPPQLNSHFRGVSFQFFYSCIESLIQLAKIKKKIKKNLKTAEKSDFWKNFVNFALWAVITKMSAIRPKFNILSSSFLQTSLFL